MVFNTIYIYSMVGSNNPTGIKELNRAKYFALVILSSFCEGIFEDEKGVNFTSLKIVHAKKYILLKGKIKGKR